MENYYIKTDKIYLNSMDSTEVSKITVGKILSYLEAHTLGGLDLVYRDWVIDFVENIEVDLPQNIIDALNAAIDPSETNYFVTIQNLFETLQNYTPLPTGDVLLNVGVISTDGSTVTMDGSQPGQPFKARISGNDVISDTLATITPNLPSSGEFRIDVFYLDQNGDYGRVQGDPSPDSNNVVPPSIPANTVAIGQALLNDSGVSNIYAYANGSYVVFSTALQGLNPAQRQNASSNLGLTTAHRQLLTSNEDIALLTRTSNNIVINTSSQITLAGLNPGFEGEEICMEVTGGGVVFLPSTGNPNTWVFRERLAIRSGNFVFLKYGNGKWNPLHDNTRKTGSGGGEDSVLYTWEDLSSQSGETPNQVAFFMRGAVTSNRASFRFVNDVDFQQSLRLGARSKSELFGIRRDELSLTYPITISGTGKLNNVSLPAGSFAIQFGSSVTEVSGINSLGDQKAIFLTSENPDGIYFEAQDSDSLAVNRSLTRIYIPYRKWVIIQYNTIDSMNRWTSVGQSDAPIDPLTPADIVDMLSSIDNEEDKLPASAIQASPVNAEQFEIDEISGELSIQTDSVPVENSERFISSGDLFEFERNNPRGSSEPSFLFNEANVPAGRSYSMIRIFNNIVFVACSSGGGNFRCIYSLDGINFQLTGATGSGGPVFYGFDISPEGTMILVSRNAAAQNIRRSADLGRTFSSINVPNELELTSVKWCYTHWVVSARSGTGNRALYSTDDGLTWLESTTHEDNEFNDVLFYKNKIFMIASTGNERLAVSEDFGITFAGKTTPLRLYTRILSFMDRLVLLNSSQTGSQPKLAYSSDEGDTWLETLTLPQGSSIISATVYNDTLYLGGNAGLIYKTKDLIDFDVIETGFSIALNDLSFFEINGKKGILASSSGNILTSL